MDVLPLESGQIDDLVQVGDQLFSLGAFSGYGIRLHSADGGWSYLPAPPAGWLVISIASGPGGLFATMSNFLPDAGSMSRVERWDGAQWTAVGPDTPGFGLQLFVDGSGTPWLVLHTSPPSGFRTTRRLTGGEWRTIGAPRLAAGESQLALASDGSAWKVWSEADGGTTVGRYVP